ncbi:MAG TPA: hypothetical protein VKY82_02715 [Flavobacterium sp.]|nr:hypothetical protein [Flavobacterium sp.]
MKGIIFLLMFLSIICWSCSNQYTYITNKNDIHYSRLFGNLKEDEEAFISIENLEEKFYLYMPCDFSYQKQVVFYENKVSVDLGETEVFTITKVFQNQNITEYEIANEYANGNLTKKKIDNKFLFRFQMNDVDYLFLTISINDLNKYPLIIHNCKEKEQEMEFDKLDLEEMWNKKIIFKSSEFSELFCFSV